MSLCPRSFTRGMRTISFFSLLFAVCAMLVCVRAEAESMSAIYRHGSLVVTIPYHAAKAETGTLVTEILDPENNVMGRMESTVQISAGGGVWEEMIAPTKPLALEDLVWQRIRYRFAFEDGKTAAIEGIESIAEVLRRPVVHVLGQTEYMAGSRAAIRVMVSDVNSHVPLRGSLRVERYGPVTFLTD